MVAADFFWDATARDVHISRGSGNNFPNLVQLSHLFGFGLDGRDITSSRDASDMLILSQDGDELPFLSCDDCDLAVLRN